jgi:hypothetical protein
MAFIKLIKSLDELYIKENLNLQIVAGICCASLVPTPTRPFQFHNSAIAPLTV